MNKIPSLFSSMVFNDEVMRDRLPKDCYNALKRNIEEGTSLELEIANVVATSMKEWAIEKGVTHYTHWFQPMTGITAEKHDSFVSPLPNGKIIMDFSGKELVKGEPDASSFPSGGIRSTFEARGYTVWDTTSFAFIKDNVLCIPTAFCSYSGEALDKKTPLLRSMDALDLQAKRVLKLFGKDDVKKVTSSVGPEQEYFLIDKDLYLKRKDLFYCGRTLFGAKAPKGQELDDHYFGAIKPRVSAFMKELNEVLWSLGIMAKTEHNEVSPAQHELATIYGVANLATDHNQLTMELMKSIADKHNLACLLHEKPFQGLNGSGKHNNWSMITDKGENLFSVKTENNQFVLFLVAVIKAVDEYQDLIRLSSASAANDHRLGGNEAPPAIVSIFLGEELTNYLSSYLSDKEFSKGKSKKMDLGTSVLPSFSKDGTDRNRTSPFAFSGNKFEFRMLGSSFSVSGPNIVINTIVAEALSYFADNLENSTDLDHDMTALIKETLIKHKRILFNGNNYSEEWVKEAENRGLLNLVATPESVECFIAEKNLQVFEKHHVFTRGEVHSRYEIMLESYVKTINIEALTLLEIVKKEISGALLKFQKELLDILREKQSLSISAGVEKDLLASCSSALDSIYKYSKILEEKLDKSSECTTTSELAKYYRSEIFTTMADLRSVIDEVEVIVPASIWAIPSYGDILYSVN